MTARNVIVTGAASGIGRALARRFFAAGDRVALVDRDEAGIARVVAELGGGPAAWPFGCDVTDSARCAEVVGEVVERWGGVDVLVNNAGLSQHGHFADTDLAVVRRVLEVNFFGSVSFTKAALASLTARKGTIVVLSSVAGFAPLVGRTAYAASKHALHGFFDSLRAELEPEGVAVLIVCPGFTDTNIDRHALGADGRPFEGKKAVVGRPLAPDEVARAIVEAVAQRRRQLVLSPVAKASYWLTRIAPELYARIMRRTQGGSRR